jgi:glucose dehydrogenase
MATSLRSSGPAALGLAVAGNAVYFNTLDGHTISLDAASGRVRWDRQTADITAGETLGSAPLVVGNVVVIGNAGDDFGARGWIKALDRESGQELWRKYSTGPDSEVGIDSSFQPYYGTDKGPDRGVGSWPPDAWRHGGGTVSGALSYDDGLNQIVHGTGHPAPGNPEQRPGDNRWTSGLFARDGATGMTRWFTSLNPHDPYGIGAGNGNVPADREWRGTSRQLRPGPGRRVHAVRRRCGAQRAAWAPGRRQSLERADPRMGDRLAAASQ